MKNSIMVLLIFAVFSTSGAQSNYPKYKKKEQDPEQKKVQTQKKKRRHKKQDFTELERQSIQNQRRLRGNRAGDGPYSDEYQYQETRRRERPLTKTEKREAERRANRTNFKTQNDEYFHTHNDGRVYDLSNGEYKTGQENKVYVDGHTRADGTRVRGNKRSYSRSRRGSRASTKASRRLSTPRRKRLRSNPLDFNRHTRGRRF